MVGYITKELILVRGGIHKKQKEWCFFPYRYRYKGAGVGMEAKDEKGPT